jgi:hypothetical protein
MLIVHKHFSIPHRHTPIVHKHFPVPHRHTLIVHKHFPVPHRHTPIVHRHFPLTHGHTPEIHGEISEYKKDMNLTLGCTMWNSGICLRMPGEFLSNSDIRSKHTGNIPELSGKIPGANCTSI